MKFEKRKYKKIDVLRLPFKVAPFDLVLQITLVIVDAIVSTTVMAYATAFFVETSIKVFEGGAVVQAIYLPLGILLAVVGIASVSGSLSQIIEAKIKFALERNFMPAILDVQARLVYKYIEDADSWELIERVGDEMTETFLDGIHAYEAVISSLIAIVSILGLIMTQVWWSGLLITIFSVPLFWISLWVGKKNYAAKVQTRKYERRYSYYSDEVLTNREAVEERTLFGYADDVTQRYYEDFEIARKIQLSVS